MHNSDGKLQYFSPNENAKPRVIFMGTPEFAVASLRALHEVCDVIAVVTLPDKPQGRGQKLTPTAVKIAAQDLGIQRIIQPVSLKSADFAEELQALQPDVICVVAFRILPKHIFEICPTFNIHGSLLPKYRGAAPINWAVIRQEKITGLTTFLLDENIDTGTILLRKSIEISPNETAGDIHDRLMILSASLACETVFGIVSKTLLPEVQDNSEATSAPKLFREMSYINWSQNCETVRAWIHGHSPIPCAWTTLSGQIFKIFRVGLIDFSQFESGNQSQPHGTYKIVQDKMLVRCADGWLELLEVQAEGKRRMPIADFLRGFRGLHEGTFSYNS